MDFTRLEKKDLLFAGFMISLAFAILLSTGVNVFFSLDPKVFIVFIFAFLTAGVGFLLHELMHKYVAQSYGFSAEFRAFKPMLWLALAFSFFGFIFAAPGAVFINGRISKKQNGKISLAGPLTNIVLALVFLILILIIRPTGLFLEFLSFGLTINSLLGAFNMIPAMPFDGAKIIAWDKTVYFTTLIIAVGLYVGSYFV